MRYAVLPLAGGEVENVIEAAEGFEIPGKRVVPCALNCARGWREKDGVLSPPAETPAPVPSASRTQLALELAARGIITETEAEEWAGGQALPQIATDAINTLPEAERSPARIRARGAGTILPDHTITQLLIAHLSIPEAERGAYRDGLFRDAAAR